jgi:hypothetical protein
MSRASSGASKIARGLVPHTLRQRSLFMSVATIVVLAAIVIALGLGATVTWTFSRMPIDIR